MQIPITVITDKVSHTIKSMVCLALRVSVPRGATVAEIAAFLHEWLPSRGNQPEVMVERVLNELHRDGRVANVGAHWYPAGMNP